jgi:hypothetical protein
MVRRTLSRQGVAALVCAVKIKGHPVVLYPVDAPDGVFERKVKDTAFRAPEHDALLEPRGAREYPNGRAIERIDDESDRHASAVIREVGSQETLTVSAGA